MANKKKTPARGKKAPTLADNVRHLHKDGKRFYTPAEWAIKQFGGARPLAAAIGIDPSNVYRWLQPPDERSRGANGRVSGRSVNDVLAAAQARKLDVTAVDLLEGRWA